MLLLDAFKFFFEEDYRYMIVSAHTSVEILYNKFFEKFLSDNNISKNKIDDLLNVTTYSYQLDPLLPLICKIKDYPSLNNNILEGLKNLRTDRNKLVHSGDADLSDKTKMKRELISAFLAFKYFNIIHGIH